MRISQLLAVTLTVTTVVAVAGCSGTSGTTATSPSPATVQTSPATATPTLNPTSVPSPAAMTEEQMDATWAAWFVDPDTAADYCRNWPRLTDAEKKAAATGWIETLEVIENGDRDPLTAAQILAVIEHACAK